MIAVLAWQQYQYVKQRVISKYPYEGIGFWKALQSFFIDIDFVGLFCFAGGFLLLLLPLTIAEGGPDGYKSGYIIAIFVLGGALLLTWPLVELRAPRPPVHIRSSSATPTSLCLVPSCSWTNSPSL